MEYDAFYLNGWHVRPRANELEKDGQVTRIPPKFMQVLAYLAQRPNRVVTREALLAEVWHDTVVVGAVLTRAVSELRKLFDDDPHAPTVIETIPKTGYRLIAPVTRPSDGVPATQRPPVARAARWTGKRAGIAVALVIGLAAAGLLTAPALHEAAPTVWKAHPLTSLPGEEVDPALSPDGRRLAFAWDPAGDVAAGTATARTVHIYSRRLDGTPPVRLTQGTATERVPAWSPDERFVAYLHCDGQGAALMLAPSVSGRPQRLTRLHADACLSPSKPAWSPDGRWLAFADRPSAREPRRLYLLALDTHERRPLTKPPPPFLGDRDPAWSPDGRQIAFARGSHRGQQLFTVTVDGGELRPLKAEGLAVEGLDWTTDGRALVFSDAGRLQQVRLDGTRPSPLTIPATYAVQPTVTATGVSYAQADYDINLWTFERTGALTPLAPSTRIDGDPRISPDGQRVAFISDRNGRCSLWLSARDGQDAFELTSFADDCMRMAYPRWSPDGRALVYAASEAGHSDLYVVSTAGGVARRLTTASSEETAPSFSQDGQWVYFASNRTGTWHVWRMPATGGVAQQLTHAGGFAALEAADGETIYFTRPDTAGLWQLPVDGGSPRRVLNHLDPRDAHNWRVTPAGIVYPERTAARVAFVRFDPAAHRTEHLAFLPDRACLRTDLAPDGSWGVLARADYGGLDVMLATPGRADEDRP